MTSRSRALCLLVPVVLALSACSTLGGTGETLSPGEGAIDFALSETCAGKAGLDCVSVNGESVVRPSTFERAGVEAAAIAEGKGQNAVDVTFTEDGAAVLHTLTAQAAGSTMRLVMKAGDEMMAAVVVAEALDGKQLQIILAPDDNAQEVIRLIQGD
jgi:hypothetical protein